MASALSYPSVLRYADKILARADQYGFPAWLPLGWIWAESGGRVGENDTSVAKLGGEKGLFQLSLDERNVTGFTDAQRMLTDVDYSLDAGFALMEHYASLIRAEGVDPSSDAYPYLIKLYHGAGDGAGRTLIRNYHNATGSLPDKWSDLEIYYTDHNFTPAGHSSHYVQDWIDQVDSINTNGQIMAGLAGVTAPITSLLPGDGGGMLSTILLLGLAGGLTWFLLSGKGR